jgi:hypothetical protein
LSKEFQSSQSAVFARMCRDAIRKSSLTKSQKEVTIVLVNIWFYHKGGKAVMHPGRKKVAKKARVSVRTVASTMDMLRAAGVLRVVSHAKGGRTSTRYKLKFAPLLILCGCDLPEWMEGELMPILRDIQSGNCTLSETEIARLPSAKIAHGNKGANSGEVEGSSQGQETSDDYLPIEESLIDYDEDWADWQPCAPFGAFGDDHE